MAKAGLKPGQKHSGQFKKGHDSRRMTTATFRNGQAMRDICRDKTPEMIEMLYGFAMDEKETTANRYKAGKYIIEQGYGKPTTPIAVSDQGGNVEKLRGAELDARIAQALSHMEKDVIGEVIDGEYQETRPQTPAMDAHELLDQE